MEGRLGYSCDGGDVGECYFLFIFFWDKRDFVLCAMMCELDTCTGLDVGLNGVAFFFSFIYLFFIIIFLRKDDSCCIIILYILYCFFTRGSHVN